MRWSWLLCGWMACTLLVGSATAQEAKAPLKVAVACSKGQLSHYETWLEKHYPVKCTWLGNEGKNSEPGLVGLEALESCDVMLLNLYRVHPTEEQLKQLQAYFAKGKPVVGLRKASHAIQTWLEIDKVVFGVRYGGHFFEKKNEQTVVIDDKGKDHPVIGDFKPFYVRGRPLQLHAPGAGGRGADERRAAR